MTQTHDINLRGWGRALTVGVSGFCAYGWLVKFDTFAVLYGAEWTVDRFSGLMAAGFCVILALALNFAVVPALRKALNWGMGVQTFGLMGMVGFLGCVNIMSVHNALIATGMVEKDLPLLETTLYWMVSIAAAFIEAGFSWYDEALKHEALMRERAEAEAERVRRRSDAEAEALRHKREAASREAGAEHEARPHGLTRRLAVAASGLSLIASPAVASESLTIEPQGRVSTLEATRPKPYDASIVQGWLEARAASPGLTQIAYAETAGIARATLQRHLKRWCDAGQPQLAG